MKILLKEQEVFIGQIVNIKGIIMKLDQGLVDRNPDLFTVVDEAIPEYVECVSRYPDFTIGRIYNFPCPIDDVGDKRVIINDWDVSDKTIFKPSTKEAYDKQTLLDKAKKDYPIGTKLIDLTDVIEEITNHNSDSELDQFDPCDTIWFNDGIVKVYSKGKWAAKYLFTTEDGVEIFEGDHYFYVGKNGEDYGKHIAVDIPDVGFCFHRRKNAEEFIAKHKEKSLQDYEDVLLKDHKVEFTVTGIKCKYLYDWLKLREPKLYWNKVLQLIADDLNGDWKADSNTKKYCIRKVEGVYLGDYFVNDIYGTIDFRSNELVDKAIKIMGDKLDKIYN